MTFTTHVLVSSTPEIIRELRDRINPGPSRKPKPPEDAGTEEVTNGSRGFRPSIPFDIDALDGADLLFASLAYWCEILDIDTSRVGRVWRYPLDHPEAPGSIRGLISDDLAPVYEVADRLLTVMETPGWREPSGMGRNMTGLLKRLSQRYPQITEVLHDRQRRANAA